MRTNGRAAFTWESGQGPALVALHGFPSSSHDWRLIAPHLPKRRLIALDFFGFGLSDKAGDGDYSLFTQADLVATVLNHYGVERCDIVAHDMGDSVAAELLKRASEGSLGFQIEHAVLANGSIFIDLARLTSGQKLFLRLPPRRLRFSPPLRLFRRQLRSLFSSEHPMPEEELQMMELLLRHGRGAALVPVTIRYIEERRRHAARWTSGLVDFPGRLSVIWGQQDPVAVSAMVDRLLALRGDVEAVRWSDVSHWPQLEVPQRFAAELDRLLSAQP